MYEVRLFTSVLYVKVLGNIYARASSEIEMPSEEFVPSPPPDDITLDDPGVGHRKTLTFYTRVIRDNPAGSKHREYNLLWEIGSVPPGTVLDEAQIIEEADLAAGYDVYVTVNKDGNEKKKASGVINQNSTIEIE